MISVVWPFALLCDTLPQFGVREKFSKKNGEDFTVASKGGGIRT